MATKLTKTRSTRKNSEIFREFRGFVIFVARAIGPDSARTCHVVANLILQHALRTLFMLKANYRRWGVAATRVVATVAMLASGRTVSLADVARGFQPSVAAAEQAGVPLKAIQISFKLDSRLSGPTYGGERWVSPRTYVGVSGQTEVDLRAAGIDANGSPVSVAPDWSASNPEMISIAPARGDRVKITINRAGEGSVRAVSQGVAKELSIKAESRNNMLQIEITPLDSKIVEAFSPAAPAPVEPPKVLSPAELAE